MESSLSREKLVPFTTSHCSCAVGTALIHLFVCFKCQITCFFFTFACQVDGTMPLTLSGLAALSLPADSSTESVQGDAGGGTGLLVGDGDAAGGIKAQEMLRAGGAKPLSTGQGRGKKWFRSSQPEQESRSSAKACNINESFNEIYICRSGACGPRCRCELWVQQCLLQDLLFYESRNKTGIYF